MPGRHAAVVQMLAHAAGLLDEYYHSAEHRVVRTSMETQLAILHALGIDATSHASAKAALRDLLERNAAQLCERSQVVTEGAQVSVSLNLPEMWARSTGEIVVHLQDGGAWRHEFEVAMPARPLIITLPQWPLPPGYHSLHVAVHGNGAQLHAVQTLIVAPFMCTKLEQLVGGAQVMGVWTNLYSAAGTTDWGMGNTGTLREIHKWLKGSAQEEAALRNCIRTRGSPQFIGLNPLHALQNRSGDVSPYSPSSRLFRSVLYIDPFSVPELTHSPEAQRLIANEESAGTIKRLRNDLFVPYDSLHEMLMPVLRALYATFRQTIAKSGGNARRDAWQRYTAREGEVLQKFALFHVLGEYLGTRGFSALDSRLWPAEYRDPHSETVRSFSNNYQDQIDFHRYLQFELDRQLGVVQRELREGGMAVGLYNDLALGSSPAGFDTWMFSDLFVSGVSVGAPPDQFAHEGQTWGCPPLSPVALARSGYAFFARTLRAAFAHSGMVRIDHVMGLWRQFWVPDGVSAREGAYVRYPSRELLAIVALESSRAGALVVGEDLGTVPDEVRPEMAARGMLSSTVFWFERGDDGGFAWPSTHKAQSLASINTHDLPTLAGWWLGRDVTSESTAEQRVADREYLLRMVAEHQLKSSAHVAGVIPFTAQENVAILALPTHDVLTDSHRDLLGRFVAAVHQLLCTSGATLVSLSVDDLALETEQVNRPGVSLQEYRSWSRKMSAAPWARG